MTNTQRSGRSAKMITAAVIAGLMGSGAMVWQASSAAFTASTENASNNWGSGKVVLSDNDSNSALFNVNNLVPNATGNNCIEVTFDGNVASSVKLYAALPTGSLGPYLDVDIELGDGVSCAVPGTYTQIYGDVNTTYDGTAANDALSGFTGSNTNFGTGVGTWTPNSPGSVHPYKITYTLGDTDLAQNKSAGVKFVWEAQNT